MRVETAQKIILTVLAVSIIREMASWLDSLFGKIPALIGSILVGAIQLFCARLARANLRYYAYILVPTMIFTIIPTALKVRDLLKVQETSLISRLWSIAPPLFGFALPVVLLVVAYRGLSLHRQESPKTLERSREGGFLFK